MTRAGIATVLVFLVASAVQAEAWHVNNAAGDDANDGRSEKMAFATIARKAKPRIGPTQPVTGYQTTPLMKEKP